MDLLSWTREKINVNPLILVMEGCGCIKYHWVVQDCSLSLKTDVYRFAMEAIDHNNVSDMEKSITLLLAGNCISLRKEYKVPQPVVKEKRFHNCLITLEVKQIKIPFVSIFSEICFQDRVEEEINVFSVFIVFIWMVTHGDNKKHFQPRCIMGFFS